MMEEDILRFVSYLENEKHMAMNILVSYLRDLIQLNEWMKGPRVT